MKSDQIPLYNPDGEDYVTTYDINEDGTPIPFVLHAGEMEYFPPSVAENIKRGLADRLVRKRGIKLNYEADFKSALHDIEVPYELPTTD